MTPGAVNADSLERIGAHLLSETDNRQAYLCLKSGIVVYTETPMRDSAAPLSKPIDQGFCNQAPIR